MTPRNTSYVSRRALSRGISAAVVVLLALLLGSACGSIPVLGSGPLEVRVVDADGGAPLAGAGVSVLGEFLSIGERVYMEPARSPPLTDDDGVLVFEGVRSSEYRLSAGHPDFVVHSELVQVGGWEPRIHVVRLRRGAKLHGRLVDESGLPMAGFSIGVLDEQQAADRRVPWLRSDVYRWERTGEDGTFQTEPLAPDEAFLLRLHAFLDGDAVAVAQKLATGLHVGVNDVGDIQLLDTVTVLQLVNEPPRDELRVYGSASSSQAADGTTTFEFGNVYFGEDGSVRVYGLPDGEFTWRLVEHRLGPAPNETLLGEGRVDLVGRHREVTLLRASAPR